MIVPFIFSGSFLKAINELQTLQYEQRLQKQKEEFQAEADRQYAEEMQRRNDSDVIDVEVREVFDMPLIGGEL